MYEINVRLPQTPYKIQIKSGILNELGDRCREVSPAKQVIIISDDTVWEIHGQSMEIALTTAGFRTESVLMRPGERSKTIECMKEICEKMIDLNVKKDFLLIAFGGGVVGDMAGFVASVYMRGIPYIQVPTTLLSQVDSSVGGKTGVDLPGGKNLLGSIYQPSLVITDPALLSTLNKNHISEGMAEIIKYGAICDEELFRRLEEYGGIDAAISDIGEIIYKCCTIKAHIVEADESDDGLRRNLNFGHTFGHAIEKIGEYESYTHGEAVAMGMKIAAGLGTLLGVTSNVTEKRVEEILTAYNLPSVLPLEIQRNYKRLVQHMTKDKKNVGKDLTIVLLKKIGESLICRIPKEDLLSKLESL